MLNLEFYKHPSELSESDEEWNQGWGLKLLK